MEKREMKMSRKCMSCGTPKGMVLFEDETFTVGHRGMTTVVEGLSGRRCGNCGEIEFDADSARRYAAAGDELVLRERARHPESLKDLVASACRRVCQAALIIRCPAFSVFPSRGSARPVFD